MSRKVLSKAMFINICIFVLTASAIAATPTILPIPQQIEFTDSNFQLTENTVIALTQDPSGHDRFLARFLTAEISDRFGLAVQTEMLSKLPNGKKIILAGTIENPLIKDYCKKTKIEIDTENPRPEGYLLHVTDNIVLIAGNDDTGAFYGLQSLRQLMQKDKDSTYITGAKIIDWPHKSFR